MHINLQCRSLIVATFGVEEKEGQNGGLRGLWDAGNALFPDLRRSLCRNLSSCTVLIYVA